MSFRMIGTLLTFREYFIKHSPGGEEVRELRGYYPKGKKVVFRSCFFTRLPQNPTHEPTNTTPTPKMEHGLGCGSVAECLPGVNEKKPRVQFPVLHKSGVMGTPVIPALGRGRRVGSSRTALALRPAWAMSYSACLYVYVSVSLSQMC